MDFTLSSSSKRRKVNVFNDNLIDAEKLYGVPISPAAPSNHQLLNFTSAASNWASTGDPIMNSATVTANVTIGTTLGVTGASTLASAAVTNNATVGGTLGVTGASTLASAAVTNNATVGGTLGVTGAATVGSTLGVTGAATLNSAAVTNNATVGGTLGVTGASTLASAAVTNNATVGGTLGVTGASTLASAAVTNNATVGGTLGVTGASTLASAAVTNNATVGGTLGVTGASTLTGGALFATTGGTPSTLSYYEDTYAAAVTWSGPWAASHNATIYFTRLGSIVTAYVQGVQATQTVGSNATCTIPARFGCNIGNAYKGGIPVINASIDALGVMYFPSNTSLLIYATATLSGFTGGGLCGWLDFVATWIY